MSVVPSFRDEGNGHPWPPFTQSCHWHLHPRGIPIPGACCHSDPARIVKLLQAADQLANSKNKLTARTWRRYRPMLYLAVDSGMRPQEYLAISRSALRDKGVYVDRAIEGGGTEISVTKTPAGRRFIELSPETLAMVRHYAENHADQERP